MARSSSVSNNLATSNFYIRATEEDSRIIFDSFKRIDEILVCMRELGIVPLPAVLHGRLVTEALQAYHAYCIEKINEAKE